MPRTNELNRNKHTKPKRDNETTKRGGKSGCHYHHKLTGFPTHAQHSRTSGGEVGAGHIEDKRLVLGVVYQRFKGDNVAPAFTAVRVHRRRKVRAIFVHFLDVDLCFPQQHVDAVRRHLKIQARIFGRHVERGL